MQRSYFISKLLKSYNPWLYGENQMQKYKSVNWSNNDYIITQNNISLYSSIISDSQNYVINVSLVIAHSEHFCALVQD